MTTGYSVSNYGRVRNDKTNRLLKPSTDGNGYIAIRLPVNGKDKNFRLHREVAKAFLPNPDNLPEVNHKKGVLSDNRASELEWVTHSQNMIHAVETGSLPVKSGESSPNAKLTESTVHKICELLQSGKSCSETANILKSEGGTLSRVKKIRSGYCWTEVSSQYKF